MLIDNCDDIYDDFGLSLDFLEIDRSPWDKFDVDEVTRAYIGGEGLEGITFDDQDSNYPMQDLMWGSVSVDIDLEDATKILKRVAEKPTVMAKSAPPPSPAVQNHQPNQRSLLIKSQPQYQTKSSASISPPISDDEGALSEPKTDTMKGLEEHINSCISDNLILDADLLEYMAGTVIQLPPLSPPPKKPSFVMDHCYSKELEPEVDLYGNNLGIETPSETDEEDFNGLYTNFPFKQENEQYDDEYEEEEEEEQKESITRMIKGEIDDEEEEIDVVSVSDHPSDIKGITVGSNNYLYPKSQHNVFGSFGTVAKKTLPIPERKCINGKYILMDMEVPSPVKRQAGRPATKPVSKKRRVSSSDDEEDDDDDDDSDSESSYKRSYSRYGSRKQRSPAKKRRVSVEMESGSDKRTLHNSLERMRRIGLKNLFDDLRNVIPSISQRERTAKVVILNTATSTVGQVQRQEEKYTAEKVALKRKQEMLRKRLSELRKSAARFR